MTDRTPHQSVSLPISAEFLPTDLQKSDALWERWVTWKASKSANTVRALNADLKAFAQFLVETGHQAAPADPAAVSMFLEKEASKGLSPATVSRRASSIATLHRLLQLPNPCDDELVLWRLQAIRRANSKPQDQALALRVKGDVEDIEKDAPEGLSVLGLLEMLDREFEMTKSISNPFEQKKAQRRLLLDMAFVSCGYDSGLRPAELVRIKKEQLDSAPDGSASLFIPFAKTDSEGEGSYRYITPDTLQRIGAWVEIAGIDQGPIFRAMKSNGVLLTAPMSTRTVQRMIKRIVERYFRSQKSNPFSPLTAEEMVTIDGISGHSFRVGICQDAFAANEDLAGIMQAFDWKTPRMPVRYAAKLSVRTGAASRLQRKVGR